MATASNEGGTRRASTTGLTAAASAFSTASILEIVERLGLVDMVVDRVKGRLEEVDIDDILDEMGDYLKRNPEVLVVALGAITIATGALVYLNKRQDTPRRSTSSTSAAGSSSGSKSKSRSSNR
jgi:hypothetical protein